MEKHLKIYSVILSLILLIWGPTFYFTIVQPTKTKVVQQHQQLSTAKDTLEKAKAKLGEYKILKDEGEQCKVLLEEKTKELAKESKWVDEIVSITKEKECPVIEKAAEKSNVNLVEKITLKTTDLAYAKWLWQPWVPYIKGSSIPSLKELFETTENEKLKAFIETSCDKKYLADWENEKEIKSLSYSYVKAFCTNEKEENCNEEVKANLEELRKGLMTKTVWVQIITKYEKWNPSNSTERLLAYYNNFWEKACLIREQTNSNWDKFYYKFY